MPFWGRQREIEKKGLRERDGKGMRERWKGDEREREMERGWEIEKREDRESLRDIFNFLALIIISAKNCLNQKEAERERKVREKGNKIIKERMMKI